MGGRYHPAVAGRMPAITPRSARSRRLVVGPQGWHTGGTFSSEVAMSVEDAVRFMLRLREDTELFARVGATAGGDIAALAAERGFAFTAGELGQALRAQRGELSDAELERASGGAALPEAAGALNPHELVQWVMRESYLQTTEDLRFYAEKAKSNQVSGDSPGIKKKWP
jgi:predicted ribosomally synthesized peptide with nif11-like leader